MNEADQKLLRQIPSVDAVLKWSRLDSFAEGVGQKIVADSIRYAVDSVRESIMSGEGGDLDAEGIEEAIVSQVKDRIDAVTRRHYRRVVNAAGIVLHTGLGRAVLCEAALEQVRQEMAGYSLLQVELEQGKRCKRYGWVEALLKTLTGAEAATVVNNNAAATSIVLNTVGAGKEVIVSRGQLVEIGGAFRLPDVMAFSGAKLVEVGATNKTHARDYENAITEETAAILRVHPSNYKITGFSSEVALDEMVDIAHSNGLVMIDDVGAGSLVDFSKYGFEPEATLAQSIAAGSDMVTASADKLIGGPQGGIILGRADLIKAVRKNQFARIVRVDKLTLAVLEATLKLFLDEATALREVPTVEMMTRKPEDIAVQAKRIADAVLQAAPGAPVATAPGFSQVGSGSLPAQNMATTLVAITPKGCSAETLAGRLRGFEVPIFARIQKEQVLLDPRTLRGDDEDVVVKALIEILAD